MRDLLRRIHLCIGAALCIPFAVLGLTGSILVFEDELRAFLEPVPHAVAAGPARPAAAIIAAARQVAPPGTVPSLFIPAHDLGEAAELRFADPKRGPGPGGVQIFVDPASLAILGQRAPGEGVLRFISTLHSNLLMRDLGGRSLVGWLGVGMLLLGATGPVLWWPRGGQWREAFTVRRGARGYNLLRDLHGMVGIWGAALLIVVSASGIYLAFPQALGGRPNLAALRVTPQPGAMLDVDGAIALAQAAVPDAALRFLLLPQRADRPYRATLTLSQARAGAPGVTLFIDPWARRVVELRDPRDYNFGDSVLAWQRPLHTGAGLGWPWRVLVFLSGFLPALFAGTGVTMWLLRRRARARARGLTLVPTRYPAAGE
jgi:uncharacterized iron-regulated membrane protein